MAMMLLQTGCALVSLLGLHALYERLYLSEEREYYRRRANAAREQQQWQHEPAAGHRGRSGLLILQPPSR